MMSRTLRCVTASLVLVLTCGDRAVAQCPGDVVPNGVVNGVDLAEVLANWGPCTSCPADLNRDGQVDGVDLAGVLSGWGLCRPIVTLISPEVGSINGGTVIQIRGQFLAGTTAVTIGGISATNVVNVSAELVTAVTPPGSLGPADVSITTASGTASFESAFFYAAIIVPSWATLVEVAPDPAVVTDAATRAAIIATSFAWRVRDTTTQIEFVLIPPGTYQRGCSPSLQWSCWNEENPVHTVTLTQPFYLGRFEITQGQWTARMGLNPSQFQGPSVHVPPDQVPLRPVERVSWNMIQSYLNGTGMRLPTEAEWEYAYRAGTVTAFHSMPGHPNGSNDDSLVESIAWIWTGNCSGGAQCEPRPVGQKASNGFGLHDMSGNVWEWVNDRFGPYSTGLQVNPVGPEVGATRVVRGGSWISSTAHARASDRSGCETQFALDSLGFRVARNP